jgi:hypothetical protein
MNPEPFSFVWWLFVGGTFSGFVALWSALFIWLPIVTGAWDE